MDPAGRPVTLELRRHPLPTARLSIHFRGTNIVAIGNYFDSRVEGRDSMKKINGSISRRVVSNYVLVLNTKEVFMYNTS